MPALQMQLSQLHLIDSALNPTSWPMTQIPVKINPWNHQLWMCQTSCCASEWKRLRTKQARRPSVLPQLPEE